MTRTTVGGGLGIIILLALWMVASHDQPEIIMPSPIQTWDALTAMAVDGVLLTEIVRTLWRAMTGVVAGLLIGGVWGLACGASKWVQAISQPAINALMAIAPVIYVAIGLIWFGPGDAVSRMVIILVTLPLTVTTVAEALRNVDAELLEMSTVFGVSPFARFRHIIVPSLTSPIMAVLTVTFGGAVRVTVMAELLAATNGIGAEVSTSRVNLETADLFAWTLVLIIVVLILESLILRPLTNRALAWRNTDTATVIDSPGTRHLPGTELKTEIPRTTT